MRPGVLALQGSSEPHVQSLRRLGHEAREVRSRAALDGLTHLVIPGGESTTLHHLMQLFELWDEVIARHRDGSLALMGTCAGAILLGRAEDGVRPPRLGLLDAVLSRNAYGRQTSSFRRNITVKPLARPFSGVFIRAPRFSSIGPAAEVLAELDGEPVLVRGPRTLAATFHPELTEDSALHALFLEL